MPAPKKKTADQYSASSVKYTIDDKEYDFAPLPIRMILGEASAIVRSNGMKALNDMLALTGNAPERRDTVARAAFNPIPITTAPLRFSDLGPFSISLLRTITVPPFGASIV